MGSEAERANRIQNLRSFLRQPENRVTPHDPISRHQEVLKSIWHHALTLSDHVPLEALKICTEALRSTQQPGESREDYARRTDAIPSKAFGTDRIAEGFDKPQHFFAVAFEAYATSLSTMHYRPFVGWSPPMTGVGEAF